MPHAFAITSTARTLTPAQLTLLCDRAAELSPAAVRMLLAEFAGSLEAVAIFTGRTDTNAHLSELLGELERKYPTAAMDGMDGKDTPVAQPEPSAFSVQPSAV